MQDNLNTHCYGSFFAGLKEPRAWGLRERLSFCFTPKHANWLNQAEIEFSALSRQCLRKGTDSIEEMKGKVAVWQQRRNQPKVSISRSYTTEDARKTLGSFIQKRSLSIKLSEY